MRCPSAAEYQDTFLTSAMLVLAGTLLFALPPTATAQWRLNPSVGVGVGYEDNPFLSVDESSGSSVDSYMVEAAATLSYNSPLTVFTIDPRVFGRRYDSFSELDSDDYFLNLNYVFTGQRSRFQLGGNYGDETTRTAERANVDFNVEDPDEIPDDDSGRVLSAEKRQRTRLKSVWSYNTGERSVIRLGGEIIESSYPDRVDQLNTDYRQIVWRSGFSYKFSERNSLTVDGYTRENSFPSNDRKISGYGATVGAVRALSERTRLTLKIGADSTEDTTEDRQTNPIGEISLLHKTQTSVVLASYRRIVSGSGTGNISVRNSASLNVSREMSEKVEIDAGILAYQTDAVDKELSTIEERDYAQLRTSLTWNLTRTFSLELDYRHTYSDRKDLPSSSDADQVNLWFRYEADR